MYQKQGVEYTQKVAAYLSRKGTKDFLPRAEFLGRLYPPNDVAIRLAFKEAQY
jgi:hypothetical protein